MKFDCYLRRAEEKGKVIFAKEYCLTDREQEILAGLGYAKKSLETLKRNPAQYASQMNNDPLDDDLIEFKREWFIKQERTPELMQQLTNVQALLSIDPAFRLKQTNDFSGITVTKSLPDGRIFVLEAKQLKINPAQLVEEIFKLVYIYKPYKVLIETVSAQVLLVNLLKEEMKKRKTFFTIEEVTTSTTETKTIKIRGLTDFYCNGRIYHLGNLVDLESQLLEFPRGVNDDIIDSLSQQIPFWKYKNSVKISTSQKEGTWDWWVSKTHQPKTGIQKLFQDLKGI